VLSVTLSLPDKPYMCTDSAVSNLWIVLRDIGADSTWIGSLQVESALGLKILGNLLPGVFNLQYSIQPPIQLKSGRFNVNRADFASSAFAQTFLAQNLLGHPPRSFLWHSFRSPIYDTPNRFIVNIAYRTPHGTHYVKFLIGYPLEYLLCIP